MLSKPGSFEDAKSPILDRIYMKLSEFHSEPFSNLDKKAFDTKYFEQSEFAQHINSVNDFSILNINNRF